MNEGKEVMTKTRANRRRIIIINEGKVKRNEKNEENMYVRKQEQKEEGG